jgi:hypothetical protein
MARVGEEFPLECPGCGGDIRLILGGGDRKTLTPGGNVADNNHIHHYGRWNRMYRNGIAIDGVGNRAAHNLIHHAPHIAISFGGNDHVLEFNEIHHVCEESNDAGAMYAGVACRCSGPRLGSLSAGNAHAASGGYALAGRAVEVAVSGTERPRQVGRDRSHGHSIPHAPQQPAGHRSDGCWEEEGGISGYEYGTNYLAVGDNGAHAIWTIIAGVSGVSGNHLRIDFPPEAPESLGSSKTVAEVPLTGLSYGTTPRR